MAMQMERVESFLLAARLKFRSHDDGHVVVGFATRHYVAPDGTKGIAIAVRLSEEGRYLECIAPGLYSLQGCRHPDAVLRTLLAIMQRTKMIRFDWDPADGEIRCAIECPVEDGVLTRRQFMRMLHAIPELVDAWDPAIRAALASGEMRLEAASSAAACRADASSRG